jgi:hypothetical protein
MRAHGAGTGFHIIRPSKPESRTMSRIWIPDIRPLADSGMTVVEAAGGFRNDGSGGGWRIPE